MLDHPDKERGPIADIQLFRALSVSLATALGAQVLLAVGLFGLLGPLTGLAGHSVPVAFLLTAAAFFPTVLAYAELSARTPGPGGSYHLVAASLPGVGAFLTGWGALLGLVSVGAILALMGGACLVAALNLLLPTLSLSPSLLALPIVLLVTLINLRGRRISRRLQGYFVAGVMALLLLLAAASLLQEVPERLIPEAVSSGPSWLIGAGVLIASLWSVEVIASIREEMRRPHHSAPRAFLIVTGLTGVLGAVVGFAASRWMQAGQFASSPAVLLAWAASLGGTWGWWLACGLGLVLSLVALNRVAITAVRQVHTQGREGYLPPPLTRIPEGRRSPVWAVMLLGAAMMGFALWGDLVALARLSGVCLLITGSLVNLAAILGRNDSGKTGGPFALPLHPFVPLLGIVVNLALLFAFSAASLVWGGVWMLAGTVLYFLYARRLRMAVQEGTTVFREEGHPKGATGYRVLVPINDPDEAAVLLNLAATLARHQEGEIVLLQVVQVPEQVTAAAGRRWAQRRLEALSGAADQVQGVPVRPVIRLARDVPRAILGTAKEEDCSLIVMGWRGPTVARQTELGPVLGPVLNEAPCNVIVVKGRELKEIQRVLVPTAGGPHAPLAAKIGLTLIQESGGQLTLLNVVPSDRESKSAIEEAHRRIAQTTANLGSLATVTVRVDVAPDPVDGIVAAAEEHDLILLGATEESILDQVLFGRFPEKVAGRTRKPVAIVKRYRGLTQTWARKTWQTLYRLFPTLDREAQAALLTQLHRGARAGQNYYILTFLSAVIAALGLLQNSAAVIIGAMLVAPLMTPILSLSLGVVLGDIRLLRVAAESVVKGVLVAVGVAMLLTFVLPAAAVTPEIAARTEPTLLDLVVALASGAAGAYALAREEVAAALPGVAIAAALMPPICTIGAGLALRQPGVSGGATLLFLTNLVAISAAGSLIFLLLGIRPKIYQRQRRALLQRGLTFSLLLLLVLAVPLGLLLARSAAEVQRGWRLESILRNQLGGAEVISLDQRLEDGTVFVRATVYALEAPSRQEIEVVQQQMDDALGRPVTLRLTVVPVAEFTVP
jgi:uncharacterized hydrophobic protein (TIGR00271 family)